jgi:hypothetical protein
VDPFRTERLAWATEIAGGVVVIAISKFAPKDGMVFCFPEMDCVPPGLTFAYTGRWVAAMHPSHRDAFCDEEAEKVQEA